MSMPAINWVKRDPDLHQMHWDGNVYMIAIEVQKQGETPQWEIDKVAVQCDEETFALVMPGCGCAYDAWSWDDVEYFKLVEGTMPEPFR